MLFFFGCFGPSVWESQVDTLFPPGQMDPLGSKRPVFEFTLQCAYSAICPLSALTFWESSSSSAQRVAPWVMAYRCQWPGSLDFESRHSQQTRPMASSLACGYVHLQHCVLPFLRKNRETMRTWERKGGSRIPAQLTFGFFFWKITYTETIFLYMKYFQVKNVLK